MGSEWYDQGRRDSFGREDRRGRREISPEDDHHGGRRRRSVSPGYRGNGDGYGRSGSRYDQGDYRNDGHDYRPDRHRDVFDNSRLGGFKERVVHKSWYRDPLSIETFLMLPQFIEFMTDGRKSGRDDELEVQYEVYKQQFIKKHQEKLFEENKAEEWFMERYHPDASVALREQVKLRRKELVAAYAQMLEEGELDNVSYDAPPESIANGSTSPANDVPMVDSNKVTTDAIMAEEDNKGDESATVPIEASVADEPSIEASVVDESTAMEDNAAKDTSGAETNADGDAIVPKVRFAEIKAPTIFIKSIPITAKRAAIEEFLKQIDGFKYLVLTDPRPDKKMSRMGWIVFEEGTDIVGTVQRLESDFKINDYQFHVAVQSQKEDRPRMLHPEFSKPERLVADLEQIKKLALHLDRECGFDEQVGVAQLEARLDLVHGKFAPPQQSETTGSADVKENEGDDSENGQTDRKEEDASKNADRSTTSSLEQTKKRLDAYIQYLHLVHSFDYYTCSEANSPEDFTRKASTCFRRPFSEFRVPREPKRDTMLTRLDMRVEYILTKPTTGPLLVRLGAKDMDEEVHNVYSRYVKMETVDKYRCIKCQKLFKAEEFVRKHLRAKHSELPEAELKETVIYYNKFATDNTKIDVTRMQSAFNQQQQPGFQQGQVAYPGGGTYGQASWGQQPRYDGGHRRSHLNHQRDDRWGGRTNDSRPPPPPPGSRRPDPRGIRTYHDLDAPAGGEIELNYD